jgi:hypothetical protein
MPPVQLARFGAITLFLAIGISCSGSKSGDDDDSANDDSAAEDSAAGDSASDGQHHDGDPQGEDADSDGWATGFGDCNDSNPEINPDSPEVPDDGVDNDCDGEIDEVIEGGGGPYSSSVRPAGTAGVDFDYASEFAWPIGTGIEYSHCRPDDGWV